MNTLEMMSMPGLTGTASIDKMLRQSRERMKEAQERRILSVAMVNAQASLETKKAKK